MARDLHTRFSIGKFPRGSDAVCVVNVFNRHCAETVIRAGYESVSGINYNDPSLVVTVDI